VYGPNLVELHELAGRVAAIARGVPGLVQVGTSSALAQPEERVIVDRTRASQLGLTPDDVLSQAYYATHGGLTTQYFNPENLRHDTILVRYARRERNVTGDLSDVQIVG
ncbi:MAG: efflux RND transporter permease subunit, partial [Acidiferrobacteraceae bacterium]